MAERDLAGALDYEPVPLAKWCNAAPEVLPDVRAAPSGHRTVQGIPFVLGDPEAPSGPQFIVVQSGGDGVTVPIGRTARSVVIAHRQLERVNRDGSGVGTPVVRYVFRLRGGRSLESEIRERYEIHTIGSDGWSQDSPFLAVSDVAAELFDRTSGAWEWAGARQTDVRTGLPQAFYLWAWRNPEPWEPVESLEIVPLAGRVLVAGITLGHVDEHPLTRSPAVPVAIELPEPAPNDPVAGPGVRIDRGIASYVYPLAGAPAESLLQDPLRGWGEPNPAKVSSCYSLVSGSPSGTLAVSVGAAEVGAVSWGEVEQAGAVEHQGLRVKVLEEGRSWVHVSVVDGDTGRPTPCRVHFRSPAGVPYQPHGHHDHVNSDLGTWHIDVGGDVRLGRITYAYIDGTCQGWLPWGDVVVDVARGYEYEPVRQIVRIAPGQRDLTLTLNRWISMGERGWYSGDSHVHFLSAQGALTEQRGEDLNVVNLLQSQWGRLFTNVEDFTGRPHESGDGPYVTFVGQENRQPKLGHLVLWGVQRPVLPFCSDGPSEAEPGAGLETTLSYWADECHAQGGTVIVPHIPRPNGELAALVATGRVDGLEMITQLEDPHTEYYRYLNCGYRLPLIGGTDKMSSDVPVGLYRTYARLGDEEFTYDGWRRAVHAGRTFLSSGPILEFQVDGAEIGDTVHIPGPGTVSVRARARSIFPVHTLQIVQDGSVVASVVDPNGARTLELDTEVRIGGHSWLAARCGGPGYFDAVRHHDLWQRGIFAHTSPVYVACGSDWWKFDAAIGRYLVTLLEGSLAYIGARAAHQAWARVAHHHGEDDHRAYLERPFREAVDALRRRLEDPSDPDLGRPRSA
ncbi:MAG TPA: CehA/McbA family metallohydrolase [Actinomycetes bacterium]